MSSDRALEIELRTDHLKKQRVGALIYAVLCGLGCIGWSLVFWPASFGVIRVQMKMFGSTTLGWVWVIGGAVLLLVATINYGRRFAIATAEISRLRATKHLG